MNYKKCFRWCNVNRKKLPNIKSFTYVFPCDFAKKKNEVKSSAFTFIFMKSIFPFLKVEIFGTGGMILQNMKNLLLCLPGLEKLELVDLQLDGSDGIKINWFFKCFCKTAHPPLKIIAKCVGLKIHFIVFYATFTSV